MPEIPKHAGRVVVSRCGRRSRKLFFIVVFAVTGGVVYWFGSAQAERSPTEQAYTSTARIVIQQQPATFDPMAPESERSPVSMPTAEEVRTMIVSDASLRRVGPVEAGPGEAGLVEEMRTRLQVSVSEAEAPQRLEISVAYTDSRPDSAAELVNALAKEFRRQCISQWQSRTLRDYLSESETCEEARREYESAKVELDSFVEQHFQNDLPDPPLPPDTSGSPRDGQADAPPLDPEEDVTRAPEESTLVENPEWTELDGRLTALRQQRRELLIDRTEAHPAVRKIDLEIADLESGLAEVPKEIPGKAPSQLGDPEDSPVAESPDVAPIPQRAELMQAYRELVEAVDRASDRLAQATLAKNRAWYQQSALPSISLKLAEPIEVQTASPIADTRLMWSALLAALVAGAGVGLVSTAAGVEPGLATVAEAQRVLPQPLLGMVPETDLAGKPRAARRRRSMVRMLMVLAGLGLIAGWAGALIRVSGYDICLSFGLR